MQININAHGIELTNEVRSYFEKCMGKIEKLVGKDADARIDAEFERVVSHTAGEEFRVEATVIGAGLQVRAEAREQTLHAAIDIAEAHLTGELRKLKGKRMDMMRRQASRLKNIFKGFRS